MNNVIDVEAIRSKVKDYVAANSILEVGTKLTDDTDIFLQGYLDSYGFVEMVKYLENEFKITFADGELVSGQLKTIANISRLVSLKVNGDK